MWNRWKKLHLIGKKATKNRKNLREAGWSHNILFDCKWKKTHSKVKFTGQRHHTNKHQKKKGLRTNTDTENSSTHSERADRRAASNGQERKSSEKHAVLQAGPPNQPLNNIMSVKKRQDAETEINYKNEKRKCFPSACWSRTTSKDGDYL